MEKEQFNYESYDAYIRRQRRVSKRGSDKTNQNKTLIEERARVLRDLYPNAKNVLCIGTRHPAEVVSFKLAGFSAIGIDLWESPPDVITCDMSKMYENPTLQQMAPFDIIYMAHSLEHCLDVDGLLKGIEWSGGKVLSIYIPIKNAPKNWDCTVFEFMHTDGDIKTIEELFVGWTLKENKTMRREKYFLLEKNI